MAGHVDAASRTLNNAHLGDELTPVGEGDDVDEAHTATEVSDRIESAGEATSRRRWRIGIGISRGRVLLAICLIVIATSAGVAGWMSYRLQQADDAQHLRNQLVQGASQMALNLTSIDYTRVEADVQRILDSSSGTFHDDFTQRSKPFIDVIGRVKSKSEGTVTGAGIESQSGDEARVLVAVSVKTTNEGAAEQDSKSWRMRISVQKTGDTVKANDVEFVP